MWKRVAIVLASATLAACGGGGGGGGSSGSSGSGGGDSGAGPAAGDARNGSYTAFVTNGSRQTLALNFDSSSYTWTDADNAVQSGSFSADAKEPGTYVFQSERITTAANTARFHLAHDTVVGAFPFIAVQNASPTYAIQPFIASRSLETQQAALDGVYNRFAIDLAPSGSTSNISQFRIDAGSTQLVRCDDANIPTIDHCSLGKLEAWSIGPDSPGGLWTMTEVANPSNTARFALARIGDQKVFLIAGKSLSDPNKGSFRIGVPEGTDWPAGTGYGSATPGSWGMVQVTADNTSTRSGTATDGSAVQTANTFYAMGPDRPTGMRQLPGNDGQLFFAMQGARIFAIVGSNSLGTGGYLQLNLMD